MCLALSYAHGAGTVSLLGETNGTNVPLGTSPVDSNGQAQFTVNFLAGAYEIFASYLGSGDSASSQSPLLDQVVYKASIAPNRRQSGLIRPPLSPADPFLP